MKTAEELLKPRYKLIARYPGCDLNIGTLCTADSDLWVRGNYHLVGKDVEKYPHLFKKLEWWEERTPEEMPEYVNIAGEVLKIIDWKDNRNGTVIRNKHYRYSISLPGSSVKPATESEYNEYKKLTLQNGNT